jgi:hypothetical protein
MTSRTSHIKIFIFSISVEDMLAPGYYRSLPLAGAIGIGLHEVSIGEMRAYMKFRNLL